jgi:glutathione S-transferase
MLKLYDAEMSGNCHKVRMMLSLLGLKHQKIKIDMQQKDHLKPEYLALNPLHQVPVIDDKGFVLRDSQAILLYLAVKHGKGKWYPKDAEGQAEVQQWLSLAANEIFHGLAVARAIVLFDRPGDAKAAKEIGEKALHAMQVRLKQREWLATGDPTIADVACYPYVALCHLGHIKLDNHPAVKAWLKRFEALPGYLPMAGMPGPA